MKRFKELINQEIVLLREMLANMQIEQESILNNETEQLKEITSQREKLIEDMLSIRQKRIDNIPKDIAADDCELVSLKDIMKTLLEKLKDHASRNSYLLKNKVTFTKTLIQQLHPDRSKPSYQEDGCYKKKTKTTTVALINREV